MLDNHPPQNYSHLSSNLNGRGKLLKKMRIKEIKHENKVLVQKMQDIVNNRGKFVTPPPRSLNDGYRKREIERINSDNRIIA